MADYEYDFQIHVCDSNSNLKTDSGAMIYLKTEPKSRENQTEF